MVGLIVGRAPVAAGVRSDQTVSALEKLAASIGPVGVASGAAVEKEQRRALSAKLVVEGDAVQGDVGF